MRGIVISQRDVVTEIAERFSDALVAERMSSFVRSEPEQEMSSRIEQTLYANKTPEKQAVLQLEIKTEGQNTSIFVFTVVTVIFLPLSFVTS